MFTTSMCGQPPSSQLSPKSGQGNALPKKLSLRRGHRGIDLISDAPPFGGFWHGQPDAISNAKFYGSSHNAVIRVYDNAGNVIETHKHKGDFKEW